MNEENTSLDFFLKQWLTVAIEDTVRDVVRDELNKFFEERFKNEKGSIQSVHDNIDNLRNEHITGLKRDVERIQENFGDLQNGIETLQLEIGELEEIRKPNGILNRISDAIFQKNDAELRTLKAAIDTANRDISDMRRTIDNLNRSLQTEKDKVGEYTKKYNDAVRDLNAKNIELSQVRRDLTDANVKISAKESELTRTKNDLSAERGRSEELKQKLDDTNIRLDTVNNELSQARAESTQTTAKLKEWTSSANIYEPVRRAITKCAIFRPLVEHYGLDDMSDTGLLVYAKAIGTTETFAGEIHTMAVENKKQTREYMTVEEAEVYDALNKVYRQNWNIAHDIFSMPGGQAVTEPFNRTSFDSLTSVVLQEPRNKSLPYTTGVYVPILMNKDGRVAQKAYVDAANR